jgi:mannose-6-phosphate isomerase-like protein (cupin superfamily)
LNNQLSTVLNGELIKSDDVYDLVDNNDLEKMTTSSTILKPGKNTRGHSHDGQEEVYVFMSGRGRMKIDDTLIDVKKDSVVPIKNGQFHQVFNDSDEEDMLFIAIFEQNRKH